MIDAPKVSIVIPAYGHAEVIGETISSVFAQTFRDFELIVIDDGSPDDTAERLGPLADEGRLTLVRQSNAGQAAARNRGLELARGRYVALLDDDDLWPVDKLAWQVERMQAEPSLVMVWGQAEQLLPDGQRVAPKATEFPPGRATQASALRRFRYRCHLLSPGQGLFRREAVRQCGGLDESVWGADDWDLYLRLCHLGPVWYEPRIALTYRLHGDNASRQAARHARNHLRVARRHLGAPWRHPWRRARNHVRTGKYFVPNLIAAARRAHEAGDAASTREALLLALRFEPYLLLRKWFRQLLRSTRDHP